MRPGCVEECVHGAFRVFMASSRSPRSRENGRLRLEGYVLAHLRAASRVTWRLEKSTGAPSRSAPTNRLTGEDQMQYQSGNISHAISAMYRVPLRIFESDDDLDNRSLRETRRYSVVR